MPAAWLALLLLLCALLLPWLGITCFNSKGEPREAIVALTMLQSGDWILPVNYGGDIPFKPPFLAWCIASLAWLFNGGVVNEYISRLPSALALIGMVMAGYCWARRRRGDRFAMIMALVTVTSVEVFRDGIVCRLDMLLTACMVAAMYLLSDMRDFPGRSNPWRLLGAVLLLNCAVCTKGPVGALLPCLIIGIYRLLRGDRFWRVLWQMLGIALLSMVAAAAWFAAAWAKGGEAFGALMYEENLGRLLGTMSYESHVKPFWYNFETLAIGLLPWTLLCLMAIANIRRHYVRSAFKPAGLLATVAAVTTVAFYCIPPSKRAVYLLPAYPFICYGIACIIVSIDRTRTLKAFTWLLAMLAVAAPVVLGMLYSPGWALLSFLPACLLAVAWALTRRDAAIYAPMLVLGLIFTYQPLVQPIVFAQRTDSAYIHRLNPAAVYTPREEGPLYVINFYLRDALRPVDTDTAASLPAGSQIIFMNDSLAGPLTRAGYSVEPFIPYSNERRRALFLATRTPGDQPTN